MARQRLSQEMVRSTTTRPRSPEGLAGAGGPPARGVPRGPHHVRSLPRIPDGRGASGAVPGPTSPSPAGRDRLQGGGVALADEGAPEVGVGVLPSFPSPHRLLRLAERLGPPLARQE